MTDPSFFVTGGPLRSDDPSYVERSADRELWEQLAQGEYCYVLTSRQMGKSSLMARSARRLQAIGTRVAAVDLTAIGGESKQVEEIWYYGLLYRLHKELNPSQQLKLWWDERAGLPVTQLVSGDDCCWHGVRSIRGVRLMRTLVSDRIRSDD